MATIFRALRSTRLALWLMILITVYIFVAIYLESWFGDLYRKWYFIALLALLAVNLMACTFHRLRAFQKPSPSTKGPSHFKEIYTFINNQNTVESFEQAIVSKGYKLSIIDEIYLAERVGKGLLGSIIFHFGMVVLLMGFSLSLLLGIQGVLIVPVGETRTVPQDLIKVKRGLFYQDKLSYQVTLDSFSPKTEGGTTTQFESTLVFDDEFNQKVQAIDINQPGKFRNVYFRTVQSGFTPRMSFVRDGVKIAEDHVILGRNDGNRYYDWIKLGQDDIQIELTADGGLTIDKENVAEVRVSIYQDKKKQAESIINQNQTVQIGDYQVSFIDYTQWLYYDVSSDPGEYLIYLGSVLVVLGLALRALSPTKRIWFKFAEGHSSQQLQLTAHSDYFTSLFELELQQLIHQIGGTLNAND